MVPHDDDSHSPSTARLDPVTQLPWPIENPDEDPQGDEPYAEPPEPTVWPDETAHVSCVMPTTNKRAFCIERSIRCWLRQTWPHRDLLVAHDGPDSAAVEKLVAPYTQQDPRIRYVHLDGERLLGTKYNEAIELTTGAYVTLWADDDWHHRKRLELVLFAMRQEKCDIGGTNTMLAYRERDKQTFLYFSNPFRPYLLGGTMIFSREAWVRSPFPNLKRASDSNFIKGLLLPVGDGTWKRWATVNDPRLYIAFVHGANTGNPLGHENDPFHETDAWKNTWQPLEGREADLTRWIEEPAAFGLQA